MTGIALIGSLTHFYHALKESPFAKKGFNCIPYFLTAAGRFKRSR